MSDDSEQMRLAELEQQAQDARTRLKEDVEALVYKLSPENLKQEAIQATQEVAADVRNEVKRWAGQAKAVARAHSVEVTLSLAFGGLLYAGVVRRNKALMWTGWTCGASAVAAVLLRAARRQSPPLLYSADEDLIPVVLDA